MAEYIEPKRENPSSTNGAIDIAPQISDQIKLLRFQETYLKYMRQEQNRALISLIMKTGFRNDILVNLNYLKGISGKPKLSQQEIAAISQINAENSDDFEYLQKLLSKNIVSVNELYQLIVIHEQRHNFGTDFPKDDKGVKTYLEQLKEIDTTIDMENIEKIAIFGSTYSVQKDRILSGKKYFEDAKGSEPKVIYLLSGFRRMYIEELVQLKILTEDELSQIQNLYRESKGSEMQNINIQVLVNFASENDLVSNILESKKDIIKTIFKQIISANSKFPTELEAVNELGEKHQEDLKITEEDIDNLPFKELFEKFSLCGEIDFFKLAADELKLSPQVVVPVYSRELGGTNIRHGVLDEKQNVRRANTQDTLKALFDMDTDIKKILFISNGAFVPQQHNAILDVVYSRFNQIPAVVQVYGKDANAGTQKNIASRHFALLSPISKHLQKDEINPKLLSGQMVSALNGITEEKAFEIGWSEIVQSISR